MSDTDIYKQREPMPVVKGHAKRSGRRRKSSRPRRAFDDNSRKRRSRNSGLRRLLHLYRKQEMERVVWWSALIILAVGLILLALWQFWYRERLIRKQELQNEYNASQNPPALYQDPSMME